MDEPDVMYVPETVHVSNSVPRSNLLAESLHLLKDALDSGKTVAQFEVGSVGSFLSFSPFTQFCFQFLNLKYKL